MINIDNFIKRLESILDYYSLSASAFADALGIQRSGLSHLMSGRNKPSLDLVMKISNTYPEVNLYWLLYGTGSFPAKEDIQKITPTTTTNVKADAGNNISQVRDLFTTEEEAIQAPKPIEILNNKPEEPDTDEKIDKIVIFYSNGTFKIYKQHQ